jgi:hypothetical protein
MFGLFVLSGLWKAVKGPLQSSVGAHGIAVLGAFLLYGLLYVRHGASTVAWVEPLVCRPSSW